MRVREALHGGAFYPKSGMLIECGTRPDRLPDLLTPHAAIIGSTNHIYVKGIQIHDSHALVMSPINDEIASTLARNRVKTGIAVMLIHERGWGYATFLSEKGSPLSSASATALCRCSIRSGKRPKTDPKIDLRHCISLRIAAAMDVHNLRLPRAMPPPNQKLLDKVNVTVRQLRLRMKVNPSAGLETQIARSESLIARLKAQVEEAARRSDESIAFVEQLLELAGRMPPAFALPFSVEAK